MYTYYSLTAMKMPFTGGLKRSMTTIQITQLVVGVQMAASYMFIRYNPFAYPDGALPSPGRFVPHPAGLLNSFESSLNSTTVAHKLQSTHWLSSTTTEALSVIRDAILNGMGAGSKSTPCVSTTGQLFAVGLNVVYLLPLIYLFVSFYIRSYKKKAIKAAAEKAAKAQ